jgi:hypothetical protein
VGPYRRSEDLSRYEEGLWQAPGCPNNHEKGERCFPQRAGAFFWSSNRETMRSRSIKIAIDFGLGHESERLQNWARHNKLLLSWMRLFAQPTYSLQKFGRARKGISSLASQSVCVLSDGSTGVFALFRNFVGTIRVLLPDVGPVQPLCK